MLDNSKVSYSFNKIYKFNSSKNYDDWAKKINHFFVFKNLTNVIYYLINYFTATEVEAYTK